MANRKQVPRMDTEQRVVVLCQQVVVWAAPLLVVIDARPHLRQVLCAAYTADIAISRCCGRAKTCAVIVDALAAGRLHADELSGPLVQMH